jgi:SNF2 family DNA or RNA helicase
VNTRTGEALPLMSHQEEGVEFLVDRKGGLLAFEQGLGKTLVAIRAFSVLLAAGKVDAVLVICPNSLKRNWTAEFARFAEEIDVSIVEGSPQVRRRQLAEVSTRAVVISYETARTEIAGVLGLLGRRRTVLVLDESHAVKNRQSLTSIAAQHFAPRCEYRWLLSGTPVTNSPGDLYAQLGIVAAGKPLGSFDSFMASYSDPKTWDHARARFGSMILRRRKDECLDLPEKTFVDLRVELPPWQRTLYNQMRDELVCEIQSMTGEQFQAFAPTALAKTLRLSQLASNPALLLPTEPRVPGKLLELDHLINEIVRLGNEKAILWSYYVGSIEKLIARYPDLGTVSLYGEIEAANRQAIAGEFQNNSAVRLLVGNPAAAGVGFTLTAATYAIYETLTWRYDLYAQSQDRIHRIGQSRPVTYIRLIAADTIEEAIVEALERKGDLARALLGDPETPGKAPMLTRDSFCEMLVRNRLPIQ